MRYFNSTAGCWIQLWSSSRNPFQSRIYASSNSLRCSKIELQQSLNHSETRKMLRPFDVLEKIVQWCWSALSAPWIVLGSFLSLGIECFGNTMILNMTEWRSYLIGRKMRRITNVKCMISTFRHEFNFHYYLRCVERNAEHLTPRLSNVISLWADYVFGYNHTHDW